MKAVFFTFLSLPTPVSPTRGEVKWRGFRCTRVGRGFPRRKNRLTGLQPEVRASRSDGWYGWSAVTAALTVLAEVCASTSSAKSDRWTGLFSAGVGKSDMYTLNKIGLSTQPCGTPFNSVRSSERASPTQTWTDLPTKKPFNQASIVPITPALVSLNRRPVSQVSSYALLMSRKTVARIFPSLIAFLSAVSNRMTWSIVQCRALKPTWSFVIMPFFSRNQCSRL